MELRPCLEVERSRPGDPGPSIPFVQVSHPYEEKGGGQKLKLATSLLLDQPINFKDRIHVGAQFRTAPAGLRRIWDPRPQFALLPHSGRADVRHGSRHQALSESECRERGDVSTSKSR